MSQQSSFSSSSSVNLTSINPLHYIFEIPFSSSIVWLATKPLDDEIAPKVSSLGHQASRGSTIEGPSGGGLTPPLVIKKQDEIGIWKGDLKSFDYSPPKIFKDGSFKKQIFGGANYNFSHAKIGCCPGEPLNIQVYGEVRGWNMFVQMACGSYTPLIWVMDFFAEHLWCWRRYLFFFLTFVLLWIIYRTNHLM